MLHKANQALALAGFKPYTHECTLLGIRGIYNKPKLTNMLRRAKKRTKKRRLLHEPQKTPNYKNSEIQKNS